MNNKEYQSVLIVIPDKKPKKIILCSPFYFSHKTIKIKEEQLSILVNNITLGLQLNHPIGQGNSNAHLLHNE